MSLETKGSTEDFVRAVVEAYFRGLLSLVRAEELILRRLESEA